MIVLIFIGEESTLSLEPLDPFVPQFLGMGLKIFETVFFVESRCFA